MAVMPCPGCSHQGAHHEDSERLDQHLVRFWRKCARCGREYSYIICRQGTDYQVLPPDGLHWRVTSEYHGTMTAALFRMGEQVMDLGCIFYNLEQVQRVGEDAMARYRAYQELLPIDKKAAEQCLRD